VDAPEKDALELRALRKHCNYRRDYVSHRRIIELQSTPGLKAVKNIREGVRGKPASTGQISRSPQSYS
jgi:hypothetical protein